MSQKGHKSNKKEATSGLIENYNKNVNADERNEESESLHHMTMCVKSARVFRKNTRRSGKNDISNMLLMS